MSVNTQLHNESFSASPQYDFPPNSYVNNMVVTVVIAIFMCVSAIGNLVTVATISSTTQLQTISNYFICSLCVSDLISTIICSPLWLHRRTWGFSQWRWGEFLCNFYWVIDFTTSFVTSLHIAAFAAFRFMVVRNPFKIWNIPRRTITGFIVFLWMFSIAISLPLILFMGVRNHQHKNMTETDWYRPSCSLLDENSGNIYYYYTVTVYPAVFTFPLVFILIFTILLSKRLIQQRRWHRRLNDNNNSNNRSEEISSFRLHLTSITTKTAFEQHEAANSDTLQNKSPCEKARKRAMRRANKRQRKIVIQLGLVVTSFLIGYIPLCSYLVWTTITPASSRSPTTDYWYGVGAYFALRFSECLNPIMYRMGSRKLRNYTRSYLEASFYRRVRCK